MLRCFHVTTFCPSAHHWTGKNMDSSGLRHLAPLDQEESVAEVFAAKLYSRHTFAPHQGATLPALIQALHIAHTSYSTCRPRYAHTASNTGILCCLQCREELLIFFLFFFFHVQKGKGRAEIPNADDFPSSPSSMAAPQRDNDFSSTIAKT